MKHSRKHLNHSQNSKQQKANQQSNYITQFALCIARHNKNNKYKSNQNNTAKQQKSKAGGR